MPVFETQSKSCRSSWLEFQTINIKFNKNQQKVLGPPPKLSASDWRTCGNFQHRVRHEPILMNQILDGHVGWLHNAAVMNIFLTHLFSNYIWLLIRKDYLYDHKLSFLLKVIWVRSWRCYCLVTWFCYQMIAKPGNKTATPSWPDPIICLIWYGLLVSVSPIVPYDTWLGHQWVRYCLSLVWCQTISWA